jgi:hypothetical protein
MTCNIYTYSVYHLPVCSKFDLLTSSSLRTSHSIITAGRQ